MQTLIVCITLSYCYLLLTCIYIVRDYCEIITAVAERRNMEFIAEELVDVWFEMDYD
jgi:hypothetical protein